MYHLIKSSQWKRNNGKWKIKAKHLIVPRIWYKNISALRLYVNAILAVHINTSPYGKRYYALTVIWELGFNPLTLNIFVIKKQVNRANQFTGFYMREHCSLVWPNPEETEYLVKFVAEILNRKLHFLCVVWWA